MNIRRAAGGVQLSAEEQLAGGVTPEMIRLSIGLEDLDDIIWDIDRSLDASRSGTPRSNADPIDADAPAVPA